VVFDARGLGKLQKFDSTDHHKSPTWKFRFTNFVCGVFGQAEEVLERARAKEEPIAASLVESELGNSVQLMSLGKQVYAVLAELAEGEALSLVMNTAARNGFEAWRKLSRRFGPQTVGRQKNAMASILNVKSVSLKELPAHIEKWEREVRHYGDSRGKGPIEDDTKTATLTQMCPKALQQHIRPNNSRLRTYALLREEIVLFISAQPEYSGPAPMDLGWLGDKGKGKGLKGGAGSDSPGGPPPQVSPGWSPWKGAQPSKSKGKGKARGRQPRGRAKAVRGKAKAKASRKSFTAIVPAAASGDA
jgi:hypothetical protein